MLPLGPCKLLKLTKFTSRKRIRFSIVQNRTKTSDSTLQMVVMIGNCDIAVPTSVKSAWIVSLGRGPVKWIAQTEPFSPASKLQVWNTPIYLYFSRFRLFKVTATHTRPKSQLEPIQLEKYANTEETMYI